MKRLLLPALAASVVAVAGCASQPYYPPPPPPPPPPYAYQSAPEVPPLVQVAQQNGFRAGSDDGARDLAYNRGYRPQHDRKFRDAPGYDPRLGPFPPYAQTFRDAYLRGYDRAFRRLQ